MKLFYMKQANEKENENGNMKTNDLFLFTTEKTPRWLSKTSNYINITEKGKKTVITFINDTLSLKSYTTYETVLIP